MFFPVVPATALEQIRENSEKEYEGNKDRYDALDEHLSSLTLPKGVSLNTAIDVFYAIKHEVFVRYPGPYEERIELGSGFLMRKSRYDELIKLPWYKRWIIDAYEYDTEDL